MSDMQSTQSVILREYR